MTPSRGDATRPRRLRTQFGRSIASGLRAMDVSMCAIVATIAFKSSEDGTFLKEQFIAKDDTKGRGRCNDSVRRRPALSSSSGIARHERKGLILDRESLNVAVIWAAARRQGTARRFTIHNGL